jgi:hypothetical protein
MIPRKPDGWINDCMGQEVDTEIDFLYEVKGTALQTRVAECPGRRCMRSSLMSRQVCFGAPKSSSVS